MSQPIVVVDAFADKPFAGNPAAVCLLPKPADEAWMQNVAREMNLSETAFLVREDDAYRLRWFTPAVGNILTMILAVRPPALAVAWGLLTALAACGRGDHTPGHADSSRVAAGPASMPVQALVDSGTDTGAVAGRIVMALARLGEGTPLGQWRAATADSVTVGANRRHFDIEARRCALGERTMTGPGWVLRREALFYAPQPPTPAVWPSDTGIALLERACTLGMIWLEVPVPDTARGARLADSIEALIATDAGAGERDAHLSFFGSAYWSHRLRWRRGSATIVLAVNGRQEAHEAEPTGPSVIAFAFNSASRISLAPATDVELEERSEPPGDSVALAHLVALAGADGAAWAPLQTVLDTLTVRSAEERRSRRQGPMPPSSALVAGLERWLRAAAALPPERRAAALLAADLALERSYCALRMCGSADSAKLEPLRALGARFEWSQLGGEWAYLHDWLLEARKLGGDGPVGDAAFMILMKRGFNLSGMCDAGSDAFRRVIAEGDAYLGRRAAAPDATTVHYLVAEAYHDIVALARGSGAEYADSTAYEAEAPDATRLALSHYHAVIAAGDTTALARAAWQRAFGLLAGIPAPDTHFFCVYD